MVEFGRDYLLTAWWIAAAPIFATALAFSLLGDARPHRSSLTEILTNTIVARGPLQSVPATVDLLNSWSHPLKITSVKATPVLVPISKSHGELWVRRTHIDRTIVEIETDAGISGVGETRCVWAAEIINNKFAPQLIGLPPLARGLMRSRCLTRGFDYGFPEYQMERSAYAAVDLAAWDIAGKYADLPLYEMIGGLQRDKAPFVAYGYPANPELCGTTRGVPSRLADWAAEAVELTGATYFEFKIGRCNDLQCDIDTVHAVREALGHKTEIGVDVNMAYSSEAATYFLDRTRSAGISNVEEPVASLSEMDRLRADYGIPISSHCTNLDAIKPYPNIDAVIPDISLLGGIDSTLELLAAARALGKRCWLRSMWELGVAFAAMCHLGISRPELSRPAQSLAGFAEDDLIDGQPWRVRDGGVRPPDRPGLGVELNHRALAKYKVA